MLPFFFAVIPAAIPPDSCYQTMFIQRLESLRGIAALMVAVGHSLVMLTVNHVDNILAINWNHFLDTQSTINRLLLVPFNGGAAVAVFFVLSGLVLGLSLDDRKNSIFDLSGFLIKRLFRIYPIHIVALLLIIASIINFHEHKIFQNASLFYNSFYNEDISLTDAICNLLLIRTNLNPVTWTLQVEILASLLIPLFHHLGRSQHVFGNTIVFLILVGIGFSSQSENFIFYSAFFLGVTLPSLGKPFINLIPERFRTITFFIAIVFLLFPRLLIDGSNRLHFLLIETLASAAVISYIVYGNRQNRCLNFLDFSIVKMLGRISYSFYIFHFIILYWMVYLVLNHLDADTKISYPILLELSLAIISVLFTFIIAWPAYKYIETPLNQLGRRLSRNISEFANRYSDRHSETDTPPPSLSPSKDLLTPNPLPGE